MEKYLKLNDVMEEIDRLIRTKQIDLIHIDYEKIKNNFTRMSKSNSFNLIIIPKIVEVIKETIEEIEYWHKDMLNEDERNHSRGNGWARVYDKLKEIDNDF